MKEEFYQVEETLNKWESINRKYSLETLTEYRRRTGKFMRDSLPGEGTFKTHSELTLKVDGRGNFCSFSGDTIVFCIDDRVKAIAAGMQEILYKNCGFMLSERLKHNTFHVTLHDLNNEDTCGNFELIMEQSKKAANNILAEIEREKAEPAGVRTVSIFNMANKSIVLGLEPADRYSCMRLMELYERFQSVVRLNYPLTLHLTLAYYKPGEYSPEHRNTLKKTFAELTRTCGWEFRLESKSLIYQRFADMNQYYTVE